MRVCECEENVCVIVTACHNVGKAAYYTEGLYKNVFECIRYTADCVLRIIGTNAFFPLI